MRLFVVLTMAVSMAQATSAPPPADQNSCPGLQEQHSLLSTLLMVTGYSDTCVAAALDYCRAGQGDSHYASLMEEAREVVQQTGAAVSKWDSELTAAIDRWNSRASAALSEWESQLNATMAMWNSQVRATANKWDSRPPRHCRDLQELGDHESSLRQVYPYPNQPHRRVTVYCDQTEDGGGWTVFQRRDSDAVRQDFNRTWLEYKLGFGDLEGEFWGGLDVLHQLTSTAMQELRIDLEDYEGEQRWAKYGFFHVGGPETKYRLSIASYSGDAGDSLDNQNGRPFSTRDADNDSHSSNCAEVYEGGWWFKNCKRSHLNGYQYVGSNAPLYHGIVWYDWKGEKYSLKGTSMKTRPAF